MKFFTDVQLERYQQLEDKYKALFTAPENCETLVQITVPNPETIRIADQIADPQKMLEQILSDAALHAEIGDDQLPMARVNFGTAQVAGALGRRLSCWKTACRRPVNRSSLPRRQSGS